MTLGFALENSSTTVDGISINPNDVLVKYALEGDINLDGSSNNADLNLFKQHFQPSQVGKARPARPRESTGDFNYDAATDNADLTLLKANFGAAWSVLANDPNMIRTISLTGIPIAPVEGQDFTGTVATFSDFSQINSVTPAPLDYSAYILWNDTLYPATVTSTGAQGQFNIGGTNLPPLTNPDQLVLADVTYASTSIFANTGRLGALSEPIQIIPAVEGLTMDAVTPASGLAGAIDLNWALNSTAATGIQILRSTNATADFLPIPAAGLSTSANSWPDTDPALTEDTDYFYEVCVTQPDGQLYYSNVADTFTLPNAPTGLSTIVSGGSVVLSWSNNSASAPSFRH